MNRSLQNIKQFRTGSVFFRFYSLIVVLVLVLISIFSIYVHRVYISHQTEQRDAAQTALLEQISGKIDNSLSLLSENGHSIWQNQVLIPAVIVPSIDKREQNFNATEFLAQNETYFEYFDRLILFEQTRDIVYSSSGGVHTLDLSGEEPLLNACVNGEERTLLEEVPHQYDVSLVSYGEDYYMVWRFIEGKNKYLGSLLAKLNMTALFSGLSDTLAGSGYGLRISDSNSNEIFSFVPKDGTTVPVQSLISSSSSFQYSLTAPDTIIAAPFSYLRLTLPFMAVVLIAGLAFSLFIAERAYHPINQLLFALPEDASRHPDARSELDVLALSLEEMRSDKEASERFREQIRPEMESNLLMKLLEEDSGTTETLSGQLKDIRSTLREDGKYQALIAFLPPTEGVDTAVEFMALRQLQLRIEKACSSETADLYFLRPNNAQLPIILQFAPALSLAKCKQVYPRILNALRDNHLTDQSVMLAGGNIYQGLLSLPESYRDASQALHKALYYNSGETEEAGTAENVSSEEQYLTSRLHRFKELYDRRELLLSEELLTQLLKELQAENTDTSVLRSKYAVVLDTLHEMIIENNLEQEAQGTIDIQDIRRQLAEITDRKALYPFMTAKCDAIMKLLREQLSSRQQILVQQARNYMKMHYSDCDLSIHEVSESLGISDPYLSSIFNEYTGESPLTYLNTYRIEIAKQLLTDSDIIIKDVGFKTGFNTIQNFNRVFKRVTGMTPGDYRRNTRQ